MPVIVGLLIVGLLGLGFFALFGYVLANNQNKSPSGVLDDAAQQELLLAQVEQLQKNFKQLEKRLNNVETIVTDAKFIDPPTSGREAIDLQAEIADLKKIIQKLR
ncbi:MAG: hypothetical protein AB8E82_07325 [Aureispira sp.]